MKVLERALDTGQISPDYQEFIHRYEKGAPWEGYTDQEVLGRYQALAPHLSPEAFERAARQSLERFSPQNRILFGQYLQQQALDHGLRVPDLEVGDTVTALRDAEMLAHALATIQQRQPGVLDQLLGNRRGILDSLLVKAALAGIVAAAARDSFGTKR